MNFIEALNEIRRRLGFIMLSQEDIEWSCRKLVADNRKVFDKLARN